jgi:hypothetical protein
MDGLRTGLEQLASVIRVNFPAYTQEVRYTDRVMRFPVLYQPGWMLEQGAPTTIVEAGVMAMGLNRITLLYHTAAGDPGDPLYFPLNAVRWRTPPRDIAALVNEAKPERFAAEVYAFGEGERRFDAEMLLLRPGTYRLSLTAAGGKVVQSGEVSVSAQNRRLAIALPPRVACVLRVEPAK